MTRRLWQRWSGRLEKPDRRAGAAAGFARLSHFDGDARYGLVANTLCSSLPRRARLSAFDP